LSRNDSTSQDTIFGRLVVEQKFCTEQELKKCRHEQKNRSTPISVEELLLEFEYITESQAERLKSSITESKTAANQIPGYKVLGKLGSGAMAVV